MAGLATGVDPALLSSLCFVESNHKVNAYVHQDGGSPSYGVCQIKLGTARALGYSGQAKGLMDQKTNAFYAASYLAKQKKKHGTWDRAISAYNAGRPIKGNKHYVNKVTKGWQRELQKRQLLSLY